MEDKDKIIAELKAEIETLKKVKDFACINLKNYIADNNKLKAENATYKANADAVHKYITQNEQLKTHIDGLEKKNAELKAYKDVNEDFKTAWEELKAENERLKEENYQLQKGCQICENFIDFIPCKPIRDMDYDLQMVINQRDKYIQTLQEIKAIAETGMHCEGMGCDFMPQILDLITKAESEEV